MLENEYAHARTFAQKSTIHNRFQTVEGEVREYVHKLTISSNNLLLNAIIVLSV